MELFARENPRPIHFMGIAGAGIGALALVARRRGIAVTGSDIDLTNATDVIAAGIEVHAGHDVAQVRDARAVVHTSAVGSAHPVLQAAAAAGIPVFRRAEALGLLVRDGFVIAVAGTHGKTTTTAMATEALAAAGRDPTGILGGRVASWGGNARIGSDELFVVEADEYDQSFLALDPDVVVVTNIEAEHLECYGSMSALEDAFEEFAGRASHVLVGADDAGAVNLARKLDVPVWRVGTAPDADVRITQVEQHPRITQADLALPGGRVVRLELRIPGMHNLRNAAMVVGVAAVVEADVDATVAALASFDGVGRRFQVLGTQRGVTVVDDYAHHATEVSATILAARQRFPGARLVVAFQPHLFSRTQRQSEQLGRALADADLVLVTDVYAAREAPIPGVTGQLVAEAARRAGAEVMWVPNRDDLAASLADVGRERDVVFTLGAGDITDVASELLHRLADAAA